MALRLLRTLRTPSPAGVATAGGWEALVDIAVFAAGLWMAVDAWAPSQDLPWTPLRLTEPWGLATSAKFGHAARDPARCRAVLRQGGVEFVEEPERQRGDCTTADTVRLTGGVTPLSPASPVMTCPQALAYAFWDRQVLRPAAARLLADRIVEVEHFGSYACRNIYGRAQAPRSQHAAANAIDVAGFRTSRNRSVTVVEAFRSEAGAGVFLRTVRRGACRYFRGVLGPDYNTAHADHFHFESGPYRLCR